MKKKIVEHIAKNAIGKLRNAAGEVQNMRDKYPELGNKRSGIGLDMQCLLESLEEADKLIDLLT